MKYVGQELDLFRHATAWKAYYSGVVQPFVRGDVLEVGGGIGGTTPYLLTRAATSYTVLEPDPDLFHALNENIRDLPLRDRVRTMKGTVADVSADPAFDTVLYIDVLEHIERDADELALAAERLRSGGVIVVLSPAFERLRSPFDDAVGHWRRYTIRSLKQVFPVGLETVCARYFDAVGAGLSLGNRIVTRDAQPTEKQIRFWNQYIIPLSRIVDPLLKKCWGRSVLVIARKDG